MEVGSHGITDDGHSYYCADQWSQWIFRHACTTVLIIYALAMSVRAFDHAPVWTLPLINIIASFGITWTYMVDLPIMKTVDLRTMSNLLACDGWSIVYYLVGCHMLTDRLERINGTFALGWRKRKYWMVHCLDIWLAAISMGILSFVPQCYDDQLIRVHVPNVIWVARVLHLILAVHACGVIIPVNIFFIRTIRRTARLSKNQTMSKRNMGFLKLVLLSNDLTLLGILITLPTLFPNTLLPDAFLYSCVGLKFLDNFVSCVVAIILFWRLRPRQIKSTSTSGSLAKSSQVSKSDWNSVVPIFEISSTEKGRNGSCNMVQMTRVTSAISIASTTIVGTAVREPNGDKDACTDGIFGTDVLAEGHESPEETFTPEDNGIDMADAV